MVHPDWVCDQNRPSYDPGARAGREALAVWLPPAGMHSTSLGAWVQEGGPGCVMAYCWRPVCFVFVSSNHGSYDRACCPLSHSPPLITFMIYHAFSNILLTDIWRAMTLKSKLYHGTSKISRWNREDMTTLLSAQFKQRSWLMDGQKTNSEQILNVVDLRPNKKPGIKSFLQAYLFWQLIPLIYPEWLQKIWLLCLRLNSNVWLRINLHFQMINLTVTKSTDWVTSVPRNFIHQWPQLLFFGV